MSRRENRSDLHDLVQSTTILEIVGDMIRVSTEEAALGDLALVENVDGTVSTAKGEISCVLMSPGTISLTPGTN